MAATDPNVPPEAQESDIKIKSTGLFRAERQVRHQEEPGPVQRRRHLDRKIRRGQSEPVLRPFAEPHPRHAGRFRKRRDARSRQQLRQCVHVVRPVPVDGRNGQRRRRARRTCSIACKTSKPAAFNEYFGKNGLDIKIGPPKPRHVAHRLSRPERAAVEYADAQVRAAQADLGLSVLARRARHRRARVRDRACDGAHRRILPKRAVRARRKAVSDFITSELGVALLLDQHVNRPGHVPQTLVTAIKRFGKKDPGPGPARTSGRFSPCTSRNAPRPR